MTPSQKKQDKVFGKKNTKTYLTGFSVIFLFALIFGTCIYPLSDGNNTEKKGKSDAQQSKPEARDKHDPQITIDQYRHVASRDGIQQWVLKASRAAYRKSVDQAVLTDIEVTFFQEENQNPILLTANKGIFKTNTQSIRAKGEVVIKTGDYTMFSDTILYNHATRVFTAPGVVKITGRGLDFEADFLRYELLTNMAGFQGHVKGILHGDLRL